MRATVAAAVMEIIRSPREFAPRSEYSSTSANSSRGDGSNMNFGAKRWYEPGSIAYTPDAIDARLMPMPYAARP